MKLIEADKVKRVMKDYWKAQVDKALTLTFTDGNEANKRINSYLEHNHELLKAIDKLPSVQPEIIRCKECKYYREYGYVNGKPKFLPRCTFSAIYVDADDFCSQAERREDATN
jgi:hypothetical protein